MKRPPNIHGMDSELTVTGTEQPGLLALLDRLYLAKFVDNTLKKIPVKKCLMLFRTQKHMVEVHDYVREQLPEFKDPSTRPYVMNHSALGPITSEFIVKQKNEFDLYLSTRYIL